MSLWNRNVRLKEKTDETDEFILSMRRLLARPEFNEYVRLVNMKAEALKNAIATTRLTGDSMNDLIRWQGKLDAYRELTGFPDTLANQSTKDEMSNA